jgi:hypothetical protein
VRLIPKFPALLRQTMMASKFAGADGDKSVAGKMR